MAGPTEVLEPLIPTVAPATDPNRPTEGLPALGSMAALQDRPQAATTASYPSNFAVGNSDIVTLNAEAKRSAETLKFKGDATGALEKISKQAAEGSDFGAHLTAILAAAAGNFGPAVQLQNQRRVAKTVGQLTPIISLANEMANSGHIQEAVELLQTTSANIADRAPEAQKVLQSSVEKLSSKQREFEQFKAATDILDKATPKEHPNRTLIDQFKIAAKSNMPWTIGMLKDMMAEARPQVTVVNGAVQVTSPLTGINKSTAADVYFDMKDVPESARTKLVAQTGMREDEITTLMRGPDSPEKQALTAQLAKLYGRDVELGIGKSLPMSPSFAEAIQQVPGVTPEQMAKRDFKPEQIRQAQDIEARQAVASKPYDKTALSQAGYASFNADVTSPDFGTFKEFLSPNETKEQGLVPLHREVITKQIQPAMNAITGLNRLKDMYAALATYKEGTPEYDAVGNGFLRFVQDLPWIGKYVPAGEKLTIANASRAIVNRALEDVENTKTIDDASIGDLKRGLTGAFQGPAGSEETVAKLQDRLKEKIAVFAGQQGLNVSRQPTGQQTSAPTGPPSAIQQQSYAIGDEAAKEFKIPTALVRAVMAQESGGGVNTTHKVGDGYGAMQITHNKTSIDQKSTADQISLLINEPVDKILTDHKTNIIAGAAWLAHLYKKNGGDVRATVRDYNGAGPMAEKYADQVMERYRKESDTVAVSKLAAKIQGSKQPLPMNW